MQIHVATIRSLIHNRVKGIVLIDEGYFELEVHINLDLAEGDPAGYCRHEVAKHLAVCAKTTEVPMYENLWLVQFSPWAQKELNMPQAFRI